MVMRGRPAIGSMMRIELRRAEDAAELLEARREIGDAHRAAVAVGRARSRPSRCCGYSPTATRHMPSSTTSVKPFSSSPASSRQNTGSPSKRGKHHHTMRASGSTSAAVRPLPITARSRFVIGHVAALRLVCCSWPRAVWRASAARRSATRTCRRCPALRGRPRSPCRRIRGSTANAASSVTSSPMKTGLRPANGACGISSRTAVPLLTRAA